MADDRASPSVAAGWPARHEGVTTPILAAVGQSGVSEQHDSSIVAPEPHSTDLEPIQPTPTAAAPDGSDDRKPDVGMGGTPDSLTSLESKTGMHRAKHIRQEVVAWVKTLASAAVYATLIVTFVAQVARVDGQSMAPTLADQDRLLVNKLAYRIGDPKVGDVVMLYYPVDPSKSFVKRVIAVEGDEVQIVNGRIYRNGSLMDDSYVAADFRSYEDWGPKVIPEGCYFVMGDHRNNSSDSRVWGYVPKKYITGKIQFRWWPPNHARVFTHQPTESAESDPRNRKR
jgi:signal peptidase I